MNAAQPQSEGLGGACHRSQVGADRLALGLPELARGLGYRYPGASPADKRDAAGERPGMPRHLVEIAEAMLAKGRELLDPQWLWLETQVTVDAQRDVLVCHSQRPAVLSVGRLVRVQLRGSQAAAAFVVTIGARLESEARALMTAGQSLEGYVLDTVGSIAVEAAADVLEEEVTTAVVDRGWNITNRFSPGYCTWETSDQHSLFSLLPEQPAGVTLSDSSLMSPIKSVSGVIGLGPEVEHRPYACELCSMTNCHQRLTEARL